MSNNSSDSVRALRTEAEMTRARLKSTVEDLRSQVSDTATDLKDRLSPTALKSEVSGYVRESRDQLWSSLGQKARDNPIQAIAVAAAVAFPAMQLLRAMPAPLLLVGAGLLLSRAGEKETLAQGTDSLKSHAENAMHRAGETMDHAREATQRTMGQVKDSAVEQLSAMRDAASETASSVSDRIADGADEMKAAMSRTADGVTSSAEQLADQARQVVVARWDQNPLLIAGIGLGIGAVIAAALPSTEVEENVFGGASNAVKSQAESLGLKGLDAAQAAVESAAANASAEGLTVEGLSNLGNSLTDKVRAVAERGLEAGLGENHSSQSHTAKEATS